MLRKELKAWELDAPSKDLKAWGLEALTKDLEAWIAVASSKDLKAWNSAWLSTDKTLQDALDETSIFNLHQMVTMGAVMGPEEATLFDNEYD